MNTVEQEFIRLLKLGATISMEKGILTFVGKGKGSGIIMGTTPPMPFLCSYSDFDIGLEVPEGALPEGEWTCVVSASECVCSCGVDGCDGSCGCSLICAGCGGPYEDCSCPGPTQDGVEYKEEDGTLYGRFTKGTL